MPFLPFCAKPLSAFTGSLPLLDDHLNCASLALPDGENTETQRNFCGCAQLPKMGMHLTGPANKF